MALCNGMYEYTFVDIGNTGRISDGGVLSNNSLNELFLNTTMFPDPSVILSTDKLFLYVVVGDEAFPLKENLMKPWRYKDFIRFYLHKIGTLLQAALHAALIKFYFNKISTENNCRVCSRSPDQCAGSPFLTA